MKRLLQNRKTLYLVLGIVIVSVFTLSVAYAAMSAVLEIHGNSEVVASSWNIHLENVKVKSGSVSANAPQISGTSSVGFDVELNTPGDFYEFTVDVVNEGSIDAMIDSVVKTPELTSEQAKYIKYEVIYENGESINTNQTLKRGTSTPIKVRVEYRKDISVSDLPSSATELSLKLTLVYVQSDGSGTNIPDNGRKLVNVVSGDGTQVGDEICVSEECFYVISSDETSVTMLAKYNLYVGGEYNGFYSEYGSEATGRQDSNMLGYTSSNDIYNGVVSFATEEYHGSDDCYACYAGSLVQRYVNNYNDYLSELGLVINEARIIKENELFNLCGEEEVLLGNTLSFCPSWVYSSSYWTEQSLLIDTVMTVWSDTTYTGMSIDFNNGLGVRPVIVVSKDYL